MRSADCINAPFSGSCHRFLIAHQVVHVPYLQDVANTLAYPGWGGFVVLPAAASLNRKFKKRRFCVHGDIEGFA